MAITTTLLISSESALSPRSGARSSVLYVTTNELDAPDCGRGARLLPVVVEKLQVAPTPQMVGPDRRRKPHRAAHDSHPTTWAVGAIGDELGITRGDQSKCIYGVAGEHLQDIPGPELA